MKTTKAPNAKLLYALLSVIGIATPIYLLGDFIATEGLNFSLAWDLSFANRINAAWSTDVIISSLTFFVLALREIRRLNMPYWPLLLLIPMDFVLGLCSALPTFLYWREQHLHKLAAAADEPLI